MVKPNPSSSNGATREINRSSSPEYEEYFQNVKKKYVYMESERRSAFTYLLAQNLPAVYLPPFPMSPDLKIYNIRIPFQNSKRKTISKVFSGEKLEA